MKKTLIALAAVAVSSAAMAQVTISGTYSVSYQKDITAATANPVFAGSTSTAPTTAVLTAGVAKGLAVTDAAIRVAASEDIGGGVRAAGDFTLETGAQRGSLTTRADSGVSLSGGFGTVAYRNTRTSDLIASIGSSAISLPDGLYDNLGIVARGAADQINYTLPTLVKGLTLGVAYQEIGDGNVALSTTAAATKSAMAYALSYTTGPVTVNAVMKKLTLVPGGSPTTKTSQQEFSASFDAGFARISVAHDGKESTAATAKAATGVSLHIPLGQASIGVQQFKRDALKQTEFGVRYDLSKRTSLTASSGKMAGHATAAKNGTQSRVRVMHTF
jgi:predicted porin